MQPLRNDQPPAASPCKVFTFESAVGNKVQGRLLSPQGLRQMRGNQSPDNNDAQRPDPRKRKCSMKRHGLIPMPAQPLDSMQPSDRKNEKMASPEQSKRSPDGRSDIRRFSSASIPASRWAHAGYSL